MPSNRGATSSNATRWKSPTSTFESHGQDFSGLPGSGTDQTGSSVVRYREVTEKVIGAAFDVHRKHGWGFLAKVYKLHWPMNTQTRLSGRSAGADTASVRSGSCWRALRRSHDR